MPRWDFQGFCGTGGFFSSFAAPAQTLQQQGRTPTESAKFLQVGERMVVHFRP
jgi:hypothetical protein